MCTLVIGAVCDLQHLGEIHIMREIRKVNKVSKTLLGGYIIYFECGECKGKLKSQRKEIGNIDTCPECHSSFKLSNDIELYIQNKIEEEEEQKRLLKDQKLQEKLESLRKCNRCEKEYDKNSNYLSVDSKHGGYICYQCQERREEEKRKEQIQREEDAKRLVIQKAKYVILSTTNNIDGYFVDEYLGIESIEHVLGTGFFSESITEFQDFFGARSSMYESKLGKAKKEAFERLKLTAAIQGADGVIGVDIDYAEFSNNRIAIIVNGTLVKLRKIDTSTIGPL